MAVLSHHSSNHTNNNNYNSTKNTSNLSNRLVAQYALFVAVSMAVSFIEFPLIPGLPWLKYDPSGIVCLIAGFAYGPKAAVIVSILGFAPHIFTNPFGAFMAILVSLGLSVPSASIYRKYRTRRGAVISLGTGLITASILAILGNLLITPLYAHMSIAQVASYIIPALLPFNLVKFALHIIVTVLIYKPISHLLQRAQR